MNEDQFKACKDDKNEYGNSLCEAVKRYKENRERKFQAEYSNLRGSVRKGLPKLRSFVYFNIPPVTHNG